MENWGLVTYRETALLIDPKNSCSSSRQWVALVVGHELAHQWFGNLVTMVPGPKIPFLLQPAQNLGLDAPKLHHAVITELIFK
nr:puromycin-sensitive aminopeptidase-like protein [Zonotrichia albicollis]